MDRIVHVEEGDADEARDLELALAISQALDKAYPNHYWLISFAGHNLVVRHVLIANVVTMETGKEGFSSLLPRDKIGTVHEACATAVKFGGELLEAFKLPRGPWDGETMPQVPQDIKDRVRRGQQLRSSGRA